ncbi:TraB/GumN family protein [Rhizobium sp. P40RR-XXII]|nr:TraB/GumN family protein [Rhizobium sp. P40RR-XXII]
MVAPRVCVAEPGHAVFWRAFFPNHEFVLFGYVRIRADLIPDIYSEGQTLISQSRAVLLDMSPNVKFSSVSFPRTQTEPVVNRLSPQAQAEFREVMKRLVPAEEIEGLPGFTASLMLSGEGQHSFSPTEPSIGFALAKYAAEAQRPLATLVSDQEVLSSGKQMTIEIFNAVGPSTVEYLLDLRRRLGPIGAYFEELYRSRESGEIARLAREMSENGVFTPTDFLDAQALRRMFIERLVAQPPGSNAFVTMPIGLLSGPISILDELRAHGATVTAVS